MKIALYLRVSTDVQDFNRQKTDLTAKAEKDKNEIAFTFSDKVSGFKNEKNRPDLNNLLLLTNEDIQAVYITELSRLSRNPTHLKVLIDQFTEKGINVYSLTQNINTLNKEGKVEFTTALMVSILSEYSSYEITLKNQRIASGKKDSILSKGNSYTYKPSFGYKKVDKKLVIDEIEAITIKDIYSKYASGESVKLLVQYLNLNNIPTRNCDFITKSDFKVNGTKTINKADIKWSKSSVRNVLKNTAYCGYKLLKGGQTIITPIIIPEELFNKCQDEMNMRITNTDRTITNDFMLRSILKCGNCGSQYLGTRSHHDLIYRCADKSHAESNSYIGCKNSQVYKTAVEDMIWTAVKGAYIQLRTKQIRDGNILTLNNNIEEYNSQIELIDSKQSALSVESDRLLKLYTKGFYDEAKLDKEQKGINAESESFNKTKRKLQAQKVESLITLQAIEEIKSNPFDLAEIEKSYELRKKAVKELLKDIFIHKVNTKYSVFKINFKADFSFYIIRETWSKKFHIADGNIFSFDPTSLIFTTNTGMVENDTTNFQISSKSIQYQPKELFDEMERQDKIENSEEFKEMVEKENIERSNRLRALEII